MQVSFIAGRDLQNAGLDLKETLLIEPGADGARDFPARQQKRLSIDVPRRRPPGRWLIMPGHYLPILAGSPARKQSVREFTNTIEITSLFCRTAGQSITLAAHLPAFMSKDSRLVHCFD